jgi:hypothetical protein
LAEQHPRYADSIVEAARAAFLHGDQWAYLAGIVAIGLGAALVFLGFPDRRRETELLRSYEAQDARPEAVEGARAGP